jgi:sugar-specific transcriptional regulator TrmB
MLNIDNKVADFLDSLGLSGTECKLYLCGLQLNEADVNDLIQETGVNRTTAYHALGTLKQKGLASEVKVQGRLVYTMTSPDGLEGYLIRKQAALEKQKQQLVEISNLFPAGSSNKDVTLVERFQGLEGVKSAVEKALYCKSRQWKIIAPKDNFFTQVDGEYARYFIRTRRERNIKARTLWERKPGKPATLSIKDFLLRQPRYLPTAFNGKFKSIIIIFDNKALFITSAEKQSAILVESEEVTGTLKVLFDGLWSASQSPVKQK